MTKEDKKKNVVQPVATSEKLMQTYEDYPVFNREQAFEEWRSGRKPLLEALTSNYTKPERQITPEQAKKAKFASALTDSLSSLAEMFAHGQGAYVRPRKGMSSQQMTNERLRQMQDKYEQDMLRYGNVIANAEMQDWQQQLRAAMSAHNQKRQHFLYQYKNALAKEQARAKAAANEEKYKRERKDKEADSAEKFKNDMALVRERAKYRHSGGGGGGTKEETPGMFINANPNDPNGRRDVLGQNVIPLNLTKQQISGYANTAKSDKDFLRANPHAYVDTFDPLTGKVVKGLTRDDNLAWMYAQWLYDKQFEGNKSTPSQSTPQWKQLSVWQQPKQNAGRYVPKVRGGRGKGNVR